MNKQTYALIIAILVALAAIGAIVFANRTAAPTEPVPVETGNASSSEPVAGQPDTTQVRIALLDTSGNGTGPSRGCDRLALTTRTIPATQAPLTAALQALFALESEQVDGNFNFIARTKGTLSFDKATVEGGVAKVYLKGSLSGLSGVCDDPRAKIQIEETALQFPTVQSVELYLDGVKTSLQPTEQ